MASVTGMTAEAIRKMFAGVETLVAERVSELNNKLSNKADRRHEHLSTDISDATHVAGTTGDSYANRVVRLGADSRLFISTASITEPGHPTNMQYVDDADRLIKDQLYIKDALTTSSVINDLGPGLYPVPFTTVSKALGLPEGEIGFLIVIWLDGRGIYRRFIWETDTSNTHEQWRATYWNGSRGAWYNPNAGMHQYSGTGFPEGKVSAPVGSIYTDTEATNGAIRWVKTSGTGSSGWAVEYGDTGWRDVRSLYVGYLGGTIQVRRVNETVTWTMQVLTAEDQTPSWNQHDGIVRPGFLPSSHMYFSAAYVNSESATGSVRIGSNGVIYTYGSKPQRRFDVVAQYPTGDAWPTSLPGTPA